MFLNVLFYHLSDVSLTYSTIFISYRIEPCSYVCNRLRSKGNRALAENITRKCDVAHQFIKSKVQILSGGQRAFMATNEISFDLAYFILTRNVQT